MKFSRATAATLGVAAGLVGGLTGVSLAGGSSTPTRQLQPAAATRAAEVSGPCDEAEHAADAACAGTSTVDDDGTDGTDDATTTTTTATDPTPAATPTSQVRTASSVGGSVQYVVEGASLRVVGTTPAAGWRSEVERATGREIEVDFRSGTSRVQVDVELEDGQVRERVRSRNEASTVTTTAPARVSDDGASHDVGDDHGGDDGRIDSSGHGGGGDDSSDDRSGHGGGDDGSHGADD
jgi:hypothetical protein